MSYRNVEGPGLSAEAGMVARGSVINVGAMTLGAALGFGLTVLASRWLQPKQAGEFFELIALFTILSNTLGLGADTGLTRWISRARAIGGLSDVRRVVLVALGPVLAFGAAAVVAVWLAAPFLAREFLHGMSQARGAAEFRLIAPFIPIGALSTCLIAAGRGFGRMWPYLAIEGVGKPALRIALVTAALVGGWQLRGAIAGWSVPVALGLAAAFVIVARLIRREAPAAARWLATDGLRNLARGFWRFAAPRGLAGMFQVTVLWIGILLVGAVLGSYQAGVFAAVSRLALIGTFALEGTRLAIAPQLSALLARREYSRASALYQGATRLLMLASWPVYLVFAIFPTISLGIFGAKYTAGATSLVVLAVAMLVNTGTGNVTVVLLMGGKSSWNVVNTLVALGVNVGLSLVLLPRIGIVGAAIAWGAGIIVDNLAAAAEVWLVLGIAPVGPGYGQVIAAACGCFGLVCGTARVMLGQSLPSMLFAAATGSVVYAGLVYSGRRDLQLTGLRAALLRGRAARADQATARPTTGTMPAVSTGTMPAVSTGTMPAVRATRGPAGPGPRPGPAGRPGRHRAPGGNRPPNRPVTEQQARRSA